MNTLKEKRMKSARELMNKLCIKSFNELANVSLLLHVQVSFKDGQDNGQSLLVKPASVTIHDSLLQFEFESSPLVVRFNFAENLDGEFADLPDKNIEITCVEFQKNGWVATYVAQEGDHEVSGSFGSPNLEVEVIR